MSSCWPLARSFVRSFVRLSKYQPIERLVNWNLTNNIQLYDCVLNLFKAQTFCLCFMFHFKMEISKSLLSFDRKTKSKSNKLLIYKRNNRFFPDMTMIWIKSFQLFMNFYWKRWNYFFPKKYVQMKYIGTAHPLMTKNKRYASYEIEATAHYYGLCWKQELYTSAKPSDFREFDELNKKNRYNNWTTFIRANICVHLAWRRKQHGHKRICVCVCAILNGYCHSMRAHLNRHQFKIQQKIMNTLTEKRYAFNLQ